MRLHAVGAPAVFWLEASYEERAVPKAAGFWWHGGNCRQPCGACKAGIALKVWWTPKRECATRLVEHADDAANAALAEHQATVAASRATDAAVEIPCGVHALPEGGRRVRDGTGGHSDR